MTGGKIFVGSTVGRGYEPDNVQCLLRLLTRHPGFVYAPVGNDALVTRSRAIAARRFVEHSECDVLLSIDTDILFEDRDAITLCEQAREYGIVAAVYVTRSRERCWPTSIFLAGKPVFFTDDPTPVEVRWAATGFVAVARRVVEAVVKDQPLCHPSSDSLRMWPIYDPIVVENDDGELIYLSEDYAFCERASRLGFKSYVNPAVRLAHLGPYPFRLEDMLIETPGRQDLKVERVQGMKYRVDSLNGALVGAGSPG